MTKLDPQLTLSTDTVTIALGYNPSVTVTRNGNGVISAVSANTNICTVEVDGTTIKLNGVPKVDMPSDNNEGTTTVTVYVAETDEYNAASKTITVTVNNTPIDGDDSVVDPDTEVEP